MVEAGGRDMPRENVEVDGRGLPRECTVLEALAGSRGRDTPRENVDVGGWESPRECTVVDALADGRYPVATDTGGRDSDLPREYKVDVGAADPPREKVVVDAARRENEMPVAEDAVLEGGRDGVSKLCGTALVMGFFQLGKRPDGASVFRIFAFFGVGLTR